MFSVLRVPVSLLVLSFYCWTSTGVTGHGRLMEPPGRSSLWRFSEFRALGAPTNYDDNQLFCGGVTVQHSRNNGKCGVCGDPYDMPRPRPNENGGTYGKGFITRTYRTGQIIPVSVELTANHFGHFEFRLCPLKRNGMVSLEKQRCFDQYPLQMGDGSGTKFPISCPKPGHFNTSLVLPTGLTCEQCVLQWHYRAANSWGMCKNGTGAVGCGPQETFRSCSDISIN